MERGSQAFSDRCSRDRARSRAQRRERARVRLQDVDHFKRESLLAPSMAAARRCDAAAGAYALSRGAVVGASRLLGRARARRVRDSSVLSSPTRCSPSGHLVSSRVFRAI